MIPTVGKRRKWQVFVEVKVLLDFDILRFFSFFLAMKGNPFILLAPMCNSVSISFLVSFLQYRRATRPELVMGFQNIFTYGQTQILLPASTYPYLNRTKLAGVGYRFYKKIQYVLTVTVLTTLDSIPVIYRCLYLQHYIC